MYADSHWFPKKIKYGKKEDAEDLYQKPKKAFDHIRMMKSLLVIIFIIACIASIFAIFVLV